MMSKTILHTEKKPLLILFFLLLTLKPAFGDSQERIIGGRAAEPGETPWMAALLIADSVPSVGQFCGGTLIHPSWIVTAAHCVVDDSGMPSNSEDIEVGLGFWNLESDQAELIGIKKIVVHPDYNLFPEDSDIALLELETPSKFDPLSIYTGTDSLEGIQGIVWGWGYLRPFGNPTDFLQKVSLPIVSNEVCNAAFNAHPGYNDSITSNMLCAGFLEGGKDSCMGDSGGPLVIDERDSRKLAGIISWGEGCAQPGFFGVHTRISKFTDFIKDIIPELTQPERICFPVIARNANMQARIGIVNLETRSVTGSFRFFNPSGEEILVNPSFWTLPPSGTVEIDFWERSPDLPDVFYAIFESDSEFLSGYVHLFREGEFETSFPAVVPSRVADMSIPVIASNSDWWTILSLTNTTGFTKTLLIHFNTDEITRVTLNPGELRVFTIRDFFAGKARPDLISAEIEGGAGIIGNAFYGGFRAAEGMIYSSVSLNEPGGRDACFLSFANDPSYWAGFLLRNSSPVSNDIVLSAYGRSGNLIEKRYRMLSPHETFLGFMEDLHLPTDTIWFHVSASSPIDRYQLFGTRKGGDFSMMPARMAESSGRSSIPWNGSFILKENGGWKALAFTNPHDVSSVLHLSAWDSQGAMIAEATRELSSRETWVGFVEDMFTTDVHIAAHIRYTSDVEMAGFQLNGSSDGMMLDGLPALARGNVAP